MRLTSVLAGCSAAALLSLAGPAEAATPETPITCGMVVEADASLYLADDLSCATPVGVRIQQDNSGDAGAPTVTVDLRGHTLRGPGAGTGISTYDYPNVIRATVTNGRVESWDVGISGGGDTTLEEMKLVDNRVGFSCWEGCRIDQTTFKANQTGFDISAETGGVITRSTFTRNEVGARVAGITSSLSVEHSRFSKNGTGLLVSQARAASSFDRFAKNAVAIRVEVDDNDFGCLSSVGDRFVKNGTDVLGPVC